MYINTWRWESWGNEQGKHDNLKVVISFRWKSIHLIAKMHSGNHTHFLVIQRQKFPFFKMKEAGIVWTDHLPFEHEMGMDMCFTAETSNNSINLWSVTLALAAANRWYSSKTEERHHLCSFLKHPTRQPVRCCKVEKKPQMSAFCTVLGKSLVSCVRDSLFRGRMQ